jgi:cytochrome c peroxidase
MKRALPLLAFAVACLFLGAARSADVPDEEALWKEATLYFDPLPPEAASESNPLTEIKVDLGAMLYFDTRLSSQGGVSCNSCHSLATFGVDNQPTSDGEGGQRGDRNSPTVLNAALHVAQFWDGRAADVEEQAGMPVLNPVEMAIPSEEFLVDRLAVVPEYVEGFARAFPGDEKPLSYGNIGRALAAFERTLLTPAPLDRYLEGDRDAISQQAKEGMQLFFELGCASCHNGVTVGGHTFRKFGLGEPYWTHTRSERIDEGRYSVTGEEEDRYLFKVAALRNVEKTDPYFHDGSVATLEEAVSIMARLQVGRQLEREEAELVTAFLRTLTGDIPESARERLRRLGLQ